MLETSDLPWQALDRDLRMFIARRVRDRSDVDDLVQRVLLQMVTSIGSLRDAGRLHAWVYQTARHAIVDYYRARGGTREFAAGGAVDLESAAATGPSQPADDDEAALREVAACLAPMLAQLPAVYRDAVRSVDLQGVPQRQAALQAGVSLSGMKSRVQRGRRQLRAILEACCRIGLDRRGSLTGCNARQTTACDCSRPAASSD